MSEITQSVKSDAGTSYPDDGSGLPLSSFLVPTTVVPARGSAVMMRTLHMKRVSDIFVSGRRNSRTR